MGRSCHAKIVIYGKGGGIGKDVVAAMSEMNYRVLVVRCIPRSESTRLLLSSFVQQTVFESLHLKGAFMDMSQYYRLDIPT